MSLKPMTLLEEIGLPPKQPISVFLRQNFLFLFEVLQWVDLYLKF